MWKPWNSYFYLTGVKEDNDCVIKEHHLICNHSSGFIDFFILASNKNDFRVILMKSFLINRDHPPLNKNRYSLPLEVNSIVGPPASAGRVLWNRLRPSVRPSFRLSLSFLRIVSLVFSETYHGVRGPYLIMCDRTRFFGKNPHWAKMTKNGQKWPKNMVFGLFKKITSLVLSEICVKWKFL